MTQSQLEEMCRKLYDVGLEAYPIENNQDYIAVWHGDEYAYYDYDAAICLLEEFGGQP